MTLLVHFFKFESLKNPVCFSACSLPVWVLLFGQTLSRSCWQRRSFLGPSWFFYTPHRRSKTVCFPHCTPTSGTPGRLSVQLQITDDSKQVESVYAIKYTYNPKRLSPLQLRTLSTDSLQVSTSSSGSLGKQHNLPLKRASRSITSPVICELHSTYHLQTTLAGQIVNHS